MSKPKRIGEKLAKILAEPTDPTKFHVTKEKAADLILGDGEVEGD